MGEPTDLEGKICYEVRNLFLDRFIMRKLHTLESVLLDVFPREYEWFRMILKLIKRDVEFEVSDIYYSECRRIVKEILMGEDNERD